MYFRHLEDLRIDNDKTQQEVADYLNCSRQVYRKYEKETHEIPISFAIELAKYYNVIIDYLVGLSDTKNRNCIKNVLQKIKKTANMHKQGI